MSDSEETDVEEFTENLTVATTKRDKELIDDLWREEKFTNRATFIRNALNEYLKEHHDEEISVKA